MAVQKKIISWIKKIVKDSKAKGIVVGVSGGIDSAVVATLCRKALGKEKVLALILPCHSHKDDVVHARLLIRWLGIPHKCAELTKTYSTLLKVLPKGNKLAKANLKPRLRMMTLYFFANSLNYLVAGTGNKSELMIGYFTKYGDGGVDILPIGKLLKCQVYQLAKELGIPDEIILKAPTAGLWPGQTDEGEMGITYKKLDNILQKCKSPRTIRNKKIKKMALRAQHKLSLPQLPPA